jgi:nucleoid-associated protein YgaU
MAPVKVRTQRLFACPSGRCVLREREAKDMPNDAKLGLVRHTVKEGETLFSLARHYYKDGRRFVDIYHANEAALPTPEPLTPGTVLLIPVLPAPAEETGRAAE